MIGKKPKHAAPKPEKKKGKEPCKACEGTGTILPPVGVKGQPKTCKTCGGKG